MKITELMKIAKENDYELKSDLIRLRFEREVECGVNQVDINKLFPNRLWISNPQYCDEKDFNMIKAAISFCDASSPEREEEKKFYLMHKYFKSAIGSNKYFCIHVKNGLPFLSYYEITSTCKFEFTLKEIEDIKKKFDTDLKDFELVEVVE